MAKPRGARAERPLPPCDTMHQNAQTGNAACVAARSAASVALAFAVAFYGSLCVAARAGFLARCSTPQGGEARGGKGSGANATQGKEGRRSPAPVGRATAKRDAATPQQRARRAEREAVPRVGGGQTSPRPCATRGPAFWAVRRTRKGPSTLYSYRLFYLDGLYLWSFISGVSMVPEPMVDHQRAPKGRAEHPAGRSGRQPCKGSAKREPLGRAGQGGSPVRGARSASR